MSFNHLDLSRGLFFRSVSCRGPAHHSTGVRFFGSHNDVHYLQTSKKPAVCGKHVDTSRGNLFRGATYLRVGKGIVKQRISNAFAY